MLQYTQSLLAARFDHPLLAGLYLTAGLFAVLGFALEQAGSSQVAAAFFAVYAILVAALATFGYLLLFGARFVSQLFDRTAAHT